MQHLVPAIFLPAAERIFHIEGRPDFAGLQTRRPIFLLERAYMAVSAQQQGIGRRIITEYSGADVSTIPYWQGEDLNRKRAAYVQDGMLGDECVHTAVYAQLRRDYPHVDLHVFPFRLQGENYRVCAYNRDIAGMPRNRPFGFTEDQIESFDYWITPTNVGAEHRARSHKTHYELLEDDLGIRIEAKTPYLYFANKERQSVRSLVGGGIRRIVRSDADALRTMATIDRGDIIVVQLNASEEARTPHPLVWVSVLADLRDALPELMFIVCGNEEHVAAFYEFGGHRIGNIVYEVADALSQQMHLSAYGLLYFMERARLAITPDSYLLHAAAAYDVPTVALWQDDPETIEECRIPSPESRIKHYNYCEAVGMSTQPEEIVQRILEKMR